MQRDVVERAMAGDHRAFAKLAEESIGRLYATARLIVRSDTAAEDATQEALVNAWRFLSSLRDPDRFDAWLHRLLVNACRREVRRRRPAVIEISVVDIGDAAPDPGISLADRDQLERGFSRLDADQRAVIVLYFYRGHALAEIADILEIPVGTVKSRIHRATQTLRAALEADARVGGAVMASRA
jgi:RNA polymerase sigma-70 factor (ECF subfamily)